jgi:hypothetical protein
MDVGWLRAEAGPKRRETGTPDTGTLSEKFVVSLAGAFVPIRVAIGAPPSRYAIGEILSATVTPIVGSNSSRSG